MTGLTELQAHRAEFLRTLRNHHYDVTNDGIFLPAAKINIGGHFETWVNGHDHQIDANIVPTEGLQYIVGAALAAVTPISAFFLAPFSGNVTPTSSLTAATFSTTVTEFITYTVTTRPAWTYAAPVAGSISNAASLANFVMATGVTSQTLYGAGLLTSSVQNGTAGFCIAATRFATARSGLNAGDTLTVQYTLSTSSS